MYVYAKIYSKLKKFTTKKMAILARSNIGLDPTTAEVEGRSKGIDSNY
jgi:hypothetical protein